MSGRVLFFGKLREIAGAGEISLPEAAEGRPVSALSALLTRDNPALLEALSHASVRVAINFEIVARGMDPQVPAGSEVAYMPPMSGG